MDHTRSHPDDYSPPLANWYPLKFPVAIGFEEEIDAGAVNHWRHRRADGRSPWQKGRAPMSEPEPVKFADVDITETLDWIEGEIDLVSAVSDADGEEADYRPLRRAETLIRRLAREAGYRLTP
nr:hypothetical protein [uncultured Celeribacter sp.]